MTDLTKADIAARVRAHADFARAGTDAERQAVVDRVRKVDPAYADELAAKIKG